MDELGLTGKKGNSRNLKRKRRGRQVTSQAMKVYTRKTTTMKTREKKTMQIEKKTATIDIATNTLIW